MNVSFTHRHDYVDAATGRRRTVPAGWSGALPDDVAEAAVAAGHALAEEMPAPKTRKTDPKKEAGAA